MGRCIILAFFNICPRNKKYLDYAFGDIPLRVLYNNGITITPDFDVNLSDLNNGYKHFKVNNGKGDSFKLQVLIHKKDTIKGLDERRVSFNDALLLEAKTVISGGTDYTFEKLGEDDFSDRIARNFRNFRLTTVLNYFMRTLTPFMITSDMIGINQSVPYIITKNSSRKQSYKDYTIWELEFTRYDKLTYSNFTKTSKGVQRAIKQAKSKKSKKVSAKTKQQTNLAKCKWQTLKFSKTKKVVPCVKVLQSLLNQNVGTKLAIDGWFGKATSEAVANYQSKYRKKYGLKITGHMNLSTFNVMIGKGKQVKNKSVKTSSKNKKSTNKNSKNTSNKPKPKKNWSSIQKVK